MAKENSKQQGLKNDFFISYTKNDAEWATWVAWELECAGYSYIMMEDFPAGSRFMSQMRDALQNSKHVLAILSEAYFLSKYSSMELHAALTEDPLGETRKVIPVRIEQCDLPVILNDLIYIDLVGKAEVLQRKALLAGINGALIGANSGERVVKHRPTWPGEGKKIDLSQKSTGLPSDQPIRIQFIAADVGRGLDLKGQFNKIKAVLDTAKYSEKINFQPVFDVTNVNLFEKLNGYRPNVVHISGNQYGGNVLFPSSDGGEVIVRDSALAGLLSSLGEGMRLAIIDTCHSYQCAKRISEAVDCSIGVDDLIYDHEATRFYEVFYTAIGAGHSVADAYGQAKASLEFMDVPSSRIPKLCVNEGIDAEEFYLVHKED